MRAENQRRVPVPAQRRAILVFLGFDVDPLAGAAVVADEAAVLPLRVDDVGVGGIDHRVETVAEDGDEPVAVANAVHVGGARRAALRRIVLRASVDVVERRVVVHGDLVKLRDRQVRDVAVALASIPRFVEPAVAADDQVLGILGIDPERVVIHVFPALAQRAERLASVFGDMEQRIHRVDAVEDPGVGDDPLVVLRAGGEVRRSFGPALAAVFRAEEAALPTGCLDRGIDDIGIDGRDRQADAPLVAVGKPLVDLPPALAAVASSGRLPTRDRRRSASRHGACR